MPRIRRRIMMVIAALVILVMAFYTLEFTGQVAPEENAIEIDYSQAGISYLRPNVFANAMDPTVLLIETRRIADESLFACLEYSMLSDAKKLVNRNPYTDSTWRLVAGQVGSSAGDVLRDSIWSEDGSILARRTFSGFRICMLRLMVKDEPSPPHFTVGLDCRYTGRIRIELMDQLSGKSIASVVQTVLNSRSALSLHLSELGGFTVGGRFFVVAANTHDTKSILVLKPNGQ